MPARPTSPQTVLVVLSDPQCLRRAFVALDNSGFKVRVADCLNTAIHAVFQWGPFDALICDHDLPDGSGLAFLHWLREQVIATPFLLVSANPPPALLPSRRYAFLAKPFSGRELCRAVNQLIPAPSIAVTADSAEHGVAAA